MIGRGNVCMVSVMAVIMAAGAAWAADLSPIEQLGKALFFDTTLSSPPGQSCAACHAPEVGFTGPDQAINAGGAVYQGAVKGRFGNRKPPAAAYAGDSPQMFYWVDNGVHVWVGGVFWDGRATGWTLGDPLAEQAQGPFLNPLEQNVPNARILCVKVAQSSYASLYQQVYGQPVDFTKNVAQTYENIARAIAAYERCGEVNPFSSKFDLYLEGKAELTPQELAGLALFDNPLKGNCVSCHPAPLFTDYTYDNLGVPKNPANPFYTMPAKYNPSGADWVDLGLGAFLGTVGFTDQVAANLGKHKVPTLRNVDKRPCPGFVKAYGHNGYFKSLEQIVHFYNTRDVGDWPPPEVAANVNDQELGDLGLSAQEEAAIVAFLKTLSDGYVAPN